MWFLIKLLGAALAFLVRLKGRYLFSNRKEEFQTVDGIQFRVDAVKDKNGQVVGTVYEFPFQCQAVFKLTKESGVDALFKSLGLTTELQTSDNDFDWNVYVASDSSAVKAELTGDAKSRELILQLLSRNLKHIFCDGSTLEIRFSTDVSEHQGLRETCLQLFRQLSNLCEIPRKRFFDDPYAFRILVVESIVWSLAVYAFSSFFEMQLHAEDIFLDNFPLIRQGLITGFGIAIFLFALIALFLRSSSRGHRILVESFFVLLFSIPAGGMSFVADLNIFFDRQDPIIVEGTVTQLYSRSHRRRKGGTYYTYHVHLNPKSEPMEFSIPRHIEISSSLYRSLQVNGPITIEIGKGWLKHPWYRSIRPGSSW